MRTNPTPPVTLNRPLEGVVVAFDLDGTLVDTAPDLIGSLNVVLSECGLPAVPLASARHLVGLGARVLIRRGFAEAGEPLEEARVEPLLDRFIAVYRTRLADESPAFPGAEAALERLAAEGARLAVCTNKPETLARPLLDALGLSPRFAAVVGWTEPRPAKPDPTPLRLAVEQAGGALPRAVLVGDSVTDVQTARNAGVPALIVDWGYIETPPDRLGGDALVSRFEDVPVAVRRLTAGAVPVAARSAIG